MTVVFIKRECDRHPGCYTLTDKCERCVTEDFHAAMDDVWARVRADLAAAARSGETA